MVALGIGFALAGLLHMVAFVGRWEALRRRRPVPLRDAVAVGSGGVVAVFGMAAELWWTGGFGPWWIACMLVWMVAGTVGLLAENDRSDWLTPMNRFRRPRR